MRVADGARRNSQADIRFGSIRIYCVHPDELYRIKGLDPVNLVNEGTAVERVGSVERISKFYPLPVHNPLIAALP